MRFILVFLAFNFSVNAQAQHGFVHDWKFQYLTWTPAGMTAPENVSKIVFTVKTKKKTWVSYKLYTSTGNLQAFYKVTPSGDQPIAKLEYDVYGHRSNFQRYKKGKLKATNHYISDPKGRPVFQQKTSANNKNLLKMEWVYNADSCLSEVRSYNKKGTQVNHKAVYEYYDKNKLLRVVTYNRKGKIKKAWDYACNSEGEQLEKKKNTTQICRWENKNDSTIIKVYQTFTEKGKIARYVTTFTVQDTLPLEEKVYNEKNELVGKTTYNKSFKYILIKEYYNKNTLFAKSAYEYRDTLILSETFFWKGKLDRKITYAYNEKNLAIEIKYQDKKSKRNRTMQIAYLKKE